MDLSNAANIVLGIIAITVSVVLGITQTKKKKPVWAYTTRHIIGRDAEAPPELKYIFGEREVAEVYQTTMIFFNKGNEKYCGDLVSGGNSDLNEAIVIKFEGAEILRNPTIIARSKGATKFDVQQSNNCSDSLELHIPILNHNDGAVIETWHTKNNKIDMLHADIPLLKRFIRERPNHFYRELIVNLVFMLSLFTFILYLGLPLFDAKAYDNMAPLIFLAAFLFVPILALRDLLKYRTFPKWSRNRE